MPSQPSEAEVHQIASQLGGRAHPQVAAALRERSDRILTLWRELTLKAAPHLDRYTVREFENSIAAILESVAVALKSDDPEQVRGVLDQSPKHGFDRFLQKYGLYDMLTEERVLRAVIILELERGLDRLLAVDEAASLHAFIDIMIQQSVMELVRKQKEEFAEAEAALHRDERLASLGMLVRGINHDIANLLFPLRSRLEALQAMETRPEAKEHHKKINAAMNYLQNLSASLRQFAGQSSAQRAEAVDLHTWCEEAESLFRSIITDNIDLTCRVPEGLPPARATPTELTQAVFNLVHNSCKAIGEKQQGHVLLEASTQPTSDHLLVAITDDGPGMPPDVLAHALEPYYSTRPRAIATGLGLSLAHGIIKAAGGDLTIKSPSPGQERGVRIELTIPRVKEVTVQPPRAAAVHIADPRLRAIFRHALETRHYQLNEISFESQDFEGTSIDLLITDATPEAEPIAKRLRAAAYRDHRVGPCGSIVVEPPRYHHRATTQALTWGSPRHPFAVRLLSQAASRRDIDAACGFARMRGQDSSLPNSLGSPRAYHGRMKPRELAKYGIPRGVTMKLAQKAFALAASEGVSRDDLRSRIAAITSDPAAHVNDPLFGEFAAAMVPGNEPAGTFIARSSPAPWKQWGADLEPQSVQQMANAAELPIAVAGALMPDAHLGYGLPIGGVLATDNVVIPYAVGVDIACRMKLTVLDLPANAIKSQTDRLINAINRETAFGIGAQFRQPREHAVMDADWSITAITQRNKDKAWSQLGTSGSGNHFVEFGTLTLEQPDLGLEAGTHLALLSHSGSRGAGANVASHYSRLAMDLHPELPKQLRHLAWLDLDSEAGQKYWAAMNLMGEYAAANHAVIHRQIARNLGVDVLVDIENHHNFAWRETHTIDGEQREVIVHRKGATPAGEGVLGIIPGSMASPGFVVRGRGSDESLHSASHGAGRVMSRTAAKSRFTWSDVKKLLADREVTLLSAGIDEVPGVYKDIHEVMDQQRDLVEVVARFDPKIVKMAPPGERAED